MRTPEPPRLVLRPRAKKAYWLFVIGLTVVGSLFAVVQADLSSFASSMQSIGRPLLAATAAIALSAGSSIVAARLYANHEENQYKRMIQDIEDSVGIEPVNTFLQELHTYQSHYSGYEVHVSFKTHPDTRAILCLEFTYKYRKHLQQQRLEFEIRRIRQAEERTAFEKERGKLVEVYLSREFFFHLDEESLAALAAKQGANLERCYNIERLRINNQHVALTRREGTTTWEATAPADAMRDACDIEYRVSLPFEPDSYMTLVLEFPTRGCKFHIDSRNVPEIELALLDFIGRRHGLVTHYSTNEVEVRQDGWALAKTGVVLVWWTNQATAQSPLSIAGTHTEDSIPTESALRTA